MINRNVLLTGRPGSGKTTLVESFLRARPHLPTYGFLTREVRQNGRRMGFEIESLDGRKDVLARKGLESHARVGSYGVNVDAIDRIGVEAIEEGLRHQDALIVIDEIAKMELFSSRFRSAVLAALDAPNPLLATIQMSRAEFIEAVRQREDVTLLELGKFGRDAMIGYIDGLLGDVR
ncbi:MAG: AAA family ATPase [Candidatus Coatesbacteria bacterium]|nr:AAA family ATPase [Candidatus Coatesbacteria bacterium]